MESNFHIPIESSKPITQSLLPSTFDSNQGRRSPVLKNTNEGHRVVGTEPFFTLSPNLKLDPTPTLTSSSSRQYNQLPTPQSPNNFGYYMSNAPYTPESPFTNSPSNSYLSPGSNPPAQRVFLQKIIDEEAQTPVVSQQIATPQSSPFARGTPRYLEITTPRQMLVIVHLSKFESTAHKALAVLPHLKRILLLPRASCHRKTLFFKQSVTVLIYHSLATAKSLRGPLHDWHPRTAYLRLPPLLPTPETSKSKSINYSRSQLDSSEYQSMQVDDVLSPSTTTISKQSDVALPSSGASPPRSPPRPTVGGEMERIRQAMVQERLAQYQDAESRRPEYLIRTKRTHSETISTPLEEDREISIGITESPMKGRRLKLFQETSEESFEESLMAGGYGRYRTADWVRQPQPTHLTTPGTPGPSNIVSVLEQAQESAPPTEKELRKRKRLAAFTERTTGEGLTELHPVELEGRGRVLLDIVPDGDDPSVVDGSPYKKKGASRRRKKGELTAKDKKAHAFTAAATRDSLYRPNWPDAEFPWKLRMQEREEELKAEEAKKLKVIERFLDRDSEDEEDEMVARGFAGEVSIRRVRSKIVPLSGNPVGVRRTSFLFPSDPADARAALMSKKSVRTLSYRQEKRRRQQEHDESDDEVLCICNGRDDGRELVQCDGCQTWYHLECIGIRDISELGKEEDPWFCRRCEESPRSPSLEPELLSEPTFVPTDDRPHISPSFDAPFFQPSSLQDSPMAWDVPRMPRTPTRLRDGDYEPEVSSGSTWVDSSRQPPMTPQHLASAPRVYTHGTPGPFDTFGNYDEPFDPTSTPSRGIKFGAPFATPKTSLWSSRANGLFQTPIKASGGRTMSGRTFGGPGTLSSSLYDSGHSAACGRSLDDESPIRRVKSHDGLKVRRIMDSPLASRSMLPMPHHLLEESPIMRFNAADQRQELGHNSVP
ncbi:hypothetical protein C0995_010308 [Termitomyces sp. Mi166|nr:hypothetical protein C0995_010308 [Termitomyces sp. Mi166\